MERRKILRAPMRAFVVIAGLFGTVGCVTTTPYIYNDTNYVVNLRHSEHHMISYVRLYEKDGVIVLYGDAKEDQGGDDVKPQSVDIAVVDKSGRIVRTESLSLRPKNHKKHGWYGAMFQTRFRPVPTSGARFVVAMHNGG